jgi:hypothetical protein
VAPDGQLLVVAEVGKEERSFDNGPPWMLTPMHVETFASCGLDVIGQKIEKDDDMGSDSYVTTFKRVGA